MIAHIRVDDNNKVIQTVKQHVDKTAEYASQNLENVKLSAVGELEGKLHDLGKCSGQYLNYITKSSNGENVIRGSVNHSFAGCIYLLENYHNQPGTEHNLAIEIIVWAIGSHHGLFDCASPENDKENGFLHRLNYDKDKISYDEAIENYFNDCADKNEIDSLVKKAVDELVFLFAKIIENIGKGNYTIDKGSKANAQFFMFGMISRLVLSALIDADRRDTAEFMSDTSFDFVRADKTLWKAELDNLNAKLNKMSSDTPINKVRRSISDEAFELAQKTSNGIYRINVPTGAGKTLATLRFALSHALVCLTSRIIFVMPLLSVLEQNAKVIRQTLLHSSYVVEHHSNVVQDKMTDDELDMYELLAQTWDSPVLVTTLVQLMNTLFKGKGSAVRRMKSLVNATIIIDEVQTIPKRMTYMFNMALNFLADFCGCTIVLCSATQPCFEQVAYPLKLSKNSDIIKPNQTITSTFKRTEIIDKTNESLSISQLADFSAKLISENSSLLVIANTKKTALDLFNLLSLQLDDSVKLFHLSTAMCTRHREDTLAAVNDCLAQKGNQKVVCISTQLVEAGVDFSFESLIRVRAGIDSISQAAGRCNRSFDYPHICNVYVVRVDEENLSNLKDIQDCQMCTAEFLTKYNANSLLFDNDILSDKSVRKYYSILYGNYMGKTLPAYETNKGLLFDMLSFNKNCRINSNKDYLLLQSFKTAGDLFEVFDTQTTDIIVPYNEEAKEIICNLKSQKAQFNLNYLKENVAKAKPYTISVFKPNLNALDEMKMLDSDEGGHFITLNELCYNDRTGLDIKNNFIY